MKHMDAESLINVLPDISEAPHGPARVVSLCSQSTPEQRQAFAEKNSQAQKDSWAATTPEQREAYKLVRSEAAKKMWQERKDRAAAVSDTATISPAAVPARILWL